jgi:hypothetical protein
MDPLTAVSLAANVVQFVDFATRLVSAGNELRLSSKGALAINLEIEGVTKRLTETIRSVEASYSAFIHSSLEHRPIRDALDQTITLCRA